MTRAEQQLYDAIRRERDPENYNAQLWFKTVKPQEKKPVQSVRWFGGMKNLEKLG